MTTEARPLVVCVDDEAQVLEGLKLHLRRHFAVATYTSPTSALGALGSLGDVAVIISDMRMPGMNGAEFLSNSRAIAANAVRLLLTGQTDLGSAIAAVNEGQIFRFLQKPAPPPLLVSVAQAASEQHRLITAERVLLEQTLQGSIKALCEVLALTKPLSFGRATQLKQLVSSVATALALPNRWQLEVAAMLSHLGAVVLPDEVAEKVHYGHPLAPNEERMVREAPRAAEQLVASIPRLEAVRAIMKLALSPSALTQDDAELSRPASVLRGATEFLRLTSSGMKPELALAELARRPLEYDRAMLGALAEASRVESGSVSEMSLEALRVGMIFAEDVKMTSGSVLVTRGYTVTPNFLERVRNFSAGVVRQPLWVVVRSSTQQQQAA